MDNVNNLTTILDSWSLRTPEEKNLQDYMVSVGNLPNTQRTKINSTQDIPDNGRVWNTFQIMYYLMPKPDKAYQEKKKYQYPSWS